MKYLIKYINYPPLSKHFFNYIKFKYCGTVRRKVKYCDRKNF